MPENIPTLLEKLKYHANNSPLSQKELAIHMGYSASMVSYVLSGDRKPTFSFLSRFCSVLQLPTIQKMELLSLAGFEVLIEGKIENFEGKEFLAEDNRSYKEQRVGQIAQILKEWKIIHSATQNLLFSTDLILNAFERFRQNATQENANEIEKLWIRFCEPKAKKIRESFANLHLVKTSQIDELISLLQGVEEDSIIYGIQHLNVDDDQSIWHLQTAIYALMDELKQMLIVADLQIVQIAEDLMSM